MPSLGDKLRLERESRGIPLDEIAAETRINLRFLEALEKGELTHLPGGAFNKGFVRSYASYLGLEPEPLVREYAEEEHTATEVGRLPQRPDVLDEMRETLGRSDPAFGEELIRKTLRVGLPVVVLLGLAALGWWVVLPALEGWSEGRALEGPVARTAMIGGAEAEEAAAAADEVGGAAAGEDASLTAAAAEGQADEVEGAAVAEGQDAPGAAAGENDAAPSDVRADEAAEPAEGADTAVQTAAGAATEQRAPEPVAETTPASRTVEKVAETVAEPRAAELIAASRPEPRAAEPIAETAPEPTAPKPVRSEPVTAADAEPLGIPEYGVGMGIDQRELIGRSSRFDEGDTIFFWTRVVGGRLGEQIRHVWMRDGRPVGLIKLQVNGSHWRTHSRFTLPYNAGTSRWSVEARANDGTVLAHEEFTVGR